MSTLAERLAEVRARVESAVRHAGRPAGSVELIAVSKLQPAALIREAYAAGQRHFGENYAQELRDKAEELKDLPGLCWEAIGPLQTNKAKYVAKVAHGFHALDRLELAQELARRRTGEDLKCYLEVNAAQESSKSGVDAAGAAALAEQVRALPHLKLVGLMTLPPLDQDPRPYFDQLRKLAEKLALPELSMGTTADFEEAIEAGATRVRVGTAIFGARTR